MLRVCADLVIPTNTKTKEEEIEGEFGVNFEGEAMCGDDFSGSLDKEDQTTTILCF